jgi:hypothetical protein
MKCSGDEFSTTFDSYSSDDHEVSRVKQTTNNRLPDYNGTEKWKVWINRFEAVADLHGWSRKERLSELLPRLQGTAGDFVGKFITRTRRGLHNCVSILLPSHS